MKKYNLKQGLILMDSTKSKIVFMGKSTEKFVIPKANLNLLRYVSEPRSEEDIRVWISAHDCRWSFEDLINSGIVCQDFIEPSSLSANAKVWWQIMGEEEKLKNKNILIIGKTNLSKTLSDSLLKAGFNNIYIENFDSNSYEELSNFKIKNKIDLAILTSSIDYKLQLLCYEIFSKNGIAYTTCSYLNSLMNMGPLLISENAKYEQIFRFDEQKDNILSLHFKNEIQASSSILDSEAAAYTTSEVVKYFTGINKPETMNTKVIIDWITLSKQKFSLDEKWSSIEDDQSKLVKN